MIVEAAEADMKPEKTVEIKIMSSEWRRIRRKGSVLKAKNIRMVVTFDHETNRCLSFPNPNNGGMVAPCVELVRPLWVCVKLLHQKLAGRVDHTITQHNNFIHQIKKRS